MIFQTQSVHRQKGNNGSLPKRYQGLAFPSNYTPMFGQRTYHFWEHFYHIWSDIKLIV
jgi:hypothetical protein